MEKNINALTLYWDSSTDEGKVKKLKGWDEMSRLMQMDFISDIAWQLDGLYDEAHAEWNALLSELRKESIVRQKLEAEKALKEELRR